MPHVRRHFKKITILLITLIVCLYVLLIVHSINDKVNGREDQGFPWSLRKLRPVDVLGVVRQVASRINGDVSVKEAASYEDEDDGDVDGSENDVEDWLGDDVEYGDILYNVDGVDGDVSDGEVIDDEL